MSNAPLLQILRKPPASDDERCDICGSAVAAEHDHVLDLRARSIRCACRACYLLFTHEGAGGRHLCAIPKRYVKLPDAPARELLDSLDIPIGLAFFMQSSVTGRTTGFYPSPAGATESELPTESWSLLTAAAPALATLAIDVETVLIQARDQTTHAFIVPADCAYELVGRIRRAWQGVTGGDALQHEIEAFFDRLAQRAHAPDSMSTHAAAPRDPTDRGAGTHAVEASPEP